MQAVETMTVKLIKKVNSHNKFWWILKCKNY